MSTDHPQTVLQWETLFSKVANTVDNLPMAKGNTSNATNLGYEIITPNRLKLGRNNFRTLVGSGIKLDMAANLTAMLERNRELYCEWYKIFISNIHLLDLRPNKWLKNSRLPVVNDIVLFVFLDSEYGKGGSEWRLGKVTAVKGTQTSVSYSVRGTKAKVPPLHTVSRCARDVSILYSAGDLLVNTRKHFSAVRDERKE